MEPSAEHGAGSGAGPPLTHPKAAGLEAVVASAVQEALTRYGGGNGGGGWEKQMALIESRLGVIEKTMVTGETLQKELGNVRTEVGKVPFETFKWLLVLAGIAAAVATAIYNIWFRA